MDTRNIVLIFNGEKHVFPIGTARTFKDLATNYSKFADLMNNSKASFMLNRADYTKDSMIPSEAEVNAALATKRLSNPGYEYDNQKLMFSVMPLKVGQGHENGK